jgi:hypothetical protein
MFANATFLAKMTTRIESVKGRRLKFRYDGSEQDECNCDGDVLVGEDEELRCSLFFFFWFEVPR